MDLSDVSSYDNLLLVHEVDAAGYDCLYCLAWLDGVRADYGTSGIDDADIGIFLKSGLDEDASTLRVNHQFSIEDFIGLCLIFSDEG